MCSAPPGLYSGAQPGHTRPPWVPALESLNFRFLVPSPFPLHPRAGSPTGLHATDFNQVPFPATPPAPRERTWSPPQPARLQEAVPAGPQVPPTLQGPRVAGAQTPFSRSQHGPVPTGGKLTKALPSPARKPSPSKASLISWPGASALPFAGLPKTQLHTTREPVRPWQRPHTGRGRESFPHSTAPSARPGGPPRPTPSNEHSNDQRASPYRACFKRAPRSALPHTHPCHCVTQIQLCLNPGKRPGRTHNALVDSHSK